MKAYQYLCILYKMIKEEDRKALIQYAAGSSHFKDMSFQTVCEERFNEIALINSLSRPQKILLYNYGYLYYSIKDEPLLQAYENKWRGIFEISQRQGRIVRASFTKERQAYLSEYCMKYSTTALEMILEPEAFIETFITGIVERCMEENEKEKTPVSKVILKGLKQEEYVHPEDQKLTEMLRGNKILEVPAKLLVEYEIERFMTMQYTGSNIRVTPDNLPLVYQAVKTACRVLDMDKMPEIYIQQGFSINGFTTGVEHPILVLNGGCLSLLDYEELLFIAGHEMGHIKSQHLLYQMISQAFPYLAELAAQMTLGVAGIVGTGVQMALYNWKRKSELTADRAGLLVCQNEKAAIKALMKTAGYPPRFYDSLNEEDFLKQAEAFRDLDDAFFNKVIKGMTTLTMSHPWTVERAKELNRWYKSGGYEKLLKR